ncbi:hypothetical protein J7L49_01445 [Candidatus Bathyarchaeota archaeon]|nr:hypothetical protein [Candidatus Bathyarchaeota archaeon]
MCGIFGFTLKRKISIAMALKLLEKLEVHKYPDETKPVGGFGAGLVTFQSDKIIYKKTGKVNSFSPVKMLSNMVKPCKVSILIGHVRMPSEKFMETAKFKEAAQPYIAQCYPNLTIVSAHNGNVENYKEIKGQLFQAHFFESEKIKLIDSEVIPHYFEQLLMEESESSKALNKLFADLKGSNAISLLQISKEHLILHFIHKGKTRGLNIWTSMNGEVIFCSRKEPLIEVFKEILRRGNFEEKILIPHKKDESLKLSIPIRF